MPRYELTTDRVQPIAMRSFAELSVEERADLPQVQRAQPKPLGENRI
jgi:hypothetical protein